MKLYQEIGLEFLENIHKLRRLSLFYKMFKDQSQLYLYNLTPAKIPRNYPFRNVKEIPIIKLKHRFFESSFFPATVTEWNDLDYSLRKDPSINVFTHAQCSFHQCFHTYAMILPSMFSRMRNAPSINVFTHVHV